MRDADLVWNRAALDRGGPAPRDGDVALAALLLAHGLAMNGGVLHAVEALTPSQLQAACAGYRYFGLSDVADLLDAASQVAWTADNERKFIKAYGALLPSDADLVEKFEQHFDLHRDRYAP